MLPSRPEGTEGWGEERLRTLVSAGQHGRHSHRVWVEIQSVASAMDRAAAWTHHRAVSVVHDVMQLTPVYWNPAVHPSLGGTQLPAPGGWAKCLQVPALREEQVPAV